MGNKLVFNNVIGSFLIDNNFRIVDKAKSEEELVKKYKKVEPVDEKHLLKVLALFKSKEYFSEFYKKNMLLTKKQIKEAVNDDNLIIQAISHIDELGKISNILSKRLREWYGLYCPEFSESVASNDKFAELLLKKDKKTLLQEAGYDLSMGADMQN